MADVPPSAAFTTSFAHLARRVRRRLAARTALTGAAIGLATGVGAAAVLWWQRLGDLRPMTAALGALGAAAGVLVARRRALSDPEVALLLDRRLGTDEVIATALELSRTDDASDPARGVVLERATTTLQKADGKAVRTRLWLRRHALAPVAAAAIAALSLAPLPPAPPAPEVAPGAEMVKLADVKGLEKIEALAQADARDDAQKKRLADLAEEARKLREKLKDGAPRREVQSDVARLADGIAAERLSLGEGEQRKGLEAAIGQLGADPALEKAAKALGDRDLTAFDEEMERLANSADKESRERAKKALEEAAEAAKKEGAKDVAKMLEEQKKLFEQLEKKSEKLRELSKALEGAMGEDALGEEGKRALSELGRSGSPEAQRKLAESLERALGNMTDEQRKKLADAMKRQLEEQQAEGGGMAPGNPEELQDLADKLGTPEGQKALEEMLKQMAEAPPPGAEGERQRQLGEAERGLGELGQQLGGVPIPMAGNGPGAGNGSGSGNDGSGSGNGTGNGAGNGNGNGGPGQGGTPGPGDKGDGSTEKVEAGDLRSRAATRINPGAPMPGVVMGRTTGRPGETANLRGTGDLGEVRAQEMEGVTRGDVPEEYREQVGRYFQP